MSCAWSVPAQGLCVPVFPPAPAPFSCAHQSSYRARILSSHIPHVHALAGAVSQRAVVLPAGGPSCLSIPAQRQLVGVPSCCQPGVQSRPCPGCPESHFGCAVAGAHPSRYNLLPSAPPGAVGAASQGQQHGLSSPEGRRRRFAESRQADQLEMTRAPPVERRFFLPDPLRASARIGPSEKTPRPPFCLRVFSVHTKRCA